MSMRNERQLLVLGCSQTKRSALGKLPAIDRYDGSSYRVLRSFLRSNRWPSNLSVAVLSAKYGLIGGYTDIEDYNLRMTPDLAQMHTKKSHETLAAWAKTHDKFFFSIGKDYLPVFSDSINNELKNKAKVFEGPIGMKLNQIKELLDSSNAAPRTRPSIPQAGAGEMTYFLPDWDDLLDERYDFESDEFSGPTPKSRGDRHCCLLMQPKRMCDGVLVSLAQHFLSKGPLKQFSGTKEETLAPRNLRKHFGLDDNQALFGDCGAFSYVNEDLPSISVEKAVALYELYGFDFGASVDHIPAPTITQNGKKRELRPIELEGRVEITRKNAEQFISLAKKRKVGFTPVGTIQALSPDGYAKMAKLYHEFGYRHLALGGLVPLQDKQIEAIVRAVMSTVEKLKPRPWVHLFGIFRPKLQWLFRELKVDSFDSASYFRKAWLRSDQNYLAPNGKWYTAIRVPMTSDGRTRKRLISAGADIEKLEAKEAQVMNLLVRYGRYEVGIAEVMEAIIDYDEQLTRTSDSQSMRAKYERTLLERPWEHCNCPFCQQLGIHVVIFRGSNRNKRRGAHNTLMLYNQLG